MTLQRLRSISSAQALRVYLLAVVLAGAVVLVDSAFAAMRTPDPIPWLVLAGLAMVARSFRLNFASEPVSIATDEDTFFFAMALLFGPGPATLALRRHVWCSAFGDGCARGESRSTRPRSPSRCGSPRRLFLAAGIAPLSQSKPSVERWSFPARDDAVVFRLQLGLTRLPSASTRVSLRCRIWRLAFPVAPINYLSAGSLAFCLILLIQRPAS